jgi:hypothetical protein
VMEWIDMAQDRNQWRALVNTVLNLWVPYNAVKFLSGCTICGLSCPVNSLPLNNPSSTSWFPRFGVHKQQVPPLKRSAISCFMVIYRVRHKSVNRHPDSECKNEAKAQIITYNNKPVLPSLFTQISPRTSFAITTLIT